MSGDESRGCSRDSLQEPPAIGGFRHKSADAVELLLVHVFPFPVFADPDRNAAMATLSGSRNGMVKPELR
jgi:hypothetical protein